MTIEEEIQLSLRGERTKDDLIGRVTEYRVRRERMKKEYGDITDQLASKISFYYAAIKESDLILDRDKRAAWEINRFIGETQCFSYLDLDLAIDGYIKLKRLYDCCCVD